MQKLKTILIATLCFITVAFSQETNDWSVYAKINGVEVSYMQVDCSAKDIPSQVAYIIKITNSSNTAVTVSWDLVVWYNNEKQEHNVKEGENHHEISLSAGESIQGDCEQPFGALYVFKDFITYVSPTKLTRFELENLKVEIR